MILPADRSVALRAPGFLHRHHAFADGKRVAVLTGIPVTCSPQLPGQGHVDGPKLLSCDLAVFAVVEHVLHSVDLILQDRSGWVLLQQRASLDDMADALFPQLVRYSSLSVAGPPVGSCGGLNEPKYRENSQSCAQRIWPCTSSLGCMELWARRTSSSQSWKWVVKSALISDGVNFPLLQSRTKSEKTTTSHFSNNAVASSYPLTWMTESSNLNSCIVLCW